MRQSRDAEVLLDVRGLRKTFGGLVALDDVSLAVRRGEVLGIIGPNGAGKTTLLRAIVGAERPDRGEVWFDGRPVHGLSRHRIARAGVALAHQIPKPFRQLSVRDNVRVGTLSIEGSRAREQRERVNEILEVTGLAAVAARPARSLALLDLKRLELARALSLSPRLLLLDEVCAGLVAAEIEAILGLLERIRAAGVTLLVVEHVEQVIATLAERVLVLDWGRVVTEGTPAAIAADPDIRALYLGSRTATLGRRFRAPGRASRVRQAAPGPVELLQLEQVSADYGGAHALRGIDLELKEGEVVAVLGANGAGKTTLARVIAGLKQPSGGRVLFAGRDVSAVSPHRRVDLGIAHGHEGRHVFADLTVRENLDLGAYARRARRSRAARQDEVFALFPLLAERIDARAGDLSGGQQQMLAIGRALMASPRLLVLDEVSLGLAPVIVDTLYDTLARIAETGLSILLVEQNVHRSLAIADRVYVLDHGVVSFCGSPRELEEQGLLWQVYFGTAGSPGHQGGRVILQRKETPA